MIIADIPRNEHDRLQELYKYELLDSVYEQEFDAIVMLASRICKMPISVITLIDADRQWFKAKVGLASTETARSIAFCSHAILKDDLMEVHDASNDERFFDNPLVIQEPFIRYYAGMPMTTKAGYKLGTLCVIDQKPRKLDDEQTFALKVLSEQIIKLFELRIKHKELQKTKDVQNKMMTIMAHDIRGPLVSLKVSNEMKSDGGFSKEDIKHINKLISEQLESTIELVDNIVDWGNMQLSANAVPETVFNMHKLCNSSFSLLATDAQTKKNKLVNNINERLQIMWSARAVEFILRNLVGNANKFTRDGSITVNADAVEGVFSLSVADTGVGIKPELQQSLSKRNWINSQKGTHDEKGSGLGLKLIFEHLDAVHGTISFENNQPKGTLVRITIPIGNITEGIY